MTLNAKSGCLVCGDELKYGELDQKECIFCGQSFESEVQCTNDHYVCDSCHTTEPVEYLEHYVANTRDNNPIEMLEKIMKHPSYNMHGPEHHYLIPAVFLTAIKNSGYEVPDNYWQLVLARGADLPGGTCGYWGACASALGNGIAVSILKQCSPIKKEYYGDIHKITSNALCDISEVGGPRCCKRNTLLAAESLYDDLAEYFEIKLPRTKYICSFMSKNNECLHQECQYFPKGLPLAEGEGARRADGGITKRYDNETKTANLGCANLATFLEVQEGDVVLDLGCGRGVQAKSLIDVVGEQGAVYGLDLTEKMIIEANKDNDRDNLFFNQGDIHKLPFADEQFDLVYSNCVINHSTDKQTVYEEIYRVLKPGGYFLVGDVMSIDELPAEVANNPENIAACWGGAIPRARYLSIIKKVKFDNIEILSERQYMKNGYPMESLTMKGVKR